MPDVKRPALKLRPGATFALILAATLGVRLFVALSYDGWWGMDGGAYGQTVNYVLGRVDSYGGFVRPPLAPGWLLVPFDLGLGMDRGIKVWAAIFSLAPLIPVYLLTRKHVGTWPAVFAAGFAGLDFWWAEMFVAGALPLGAFALLGMAFYSLGELAERFSWRNAVVLALSIGLIPWVNQTTAGIAVIVLPVYWVGLVLFTLSKSQENIPGIIQGIFARAVPAIIIGGIIALGALPWYLDVLPGSNNIQHGGGPMLTLANPLHLIWVQVLFIGLALGITVIWKAPDPRIKALGAALLAVSFLAPFQSWDEVLLNIFYRSRYLMALLVYPLVTWVVFRFWWPKVHPYVKTAGIAVAVALTAAMSSTAIYHVTYHANLVTPASAAALEWLRENDPQVAVATPMWSVSQWVNAANMVPSPSLHLGEPPPAEVETDYHLRCLLNWVPHCDPVEAARFTGVRYFLIDERLPEILDQPGRICCNYGAPPDQWEVTARAAWLHLAFQQGDTKLWRIELDDGPEPIAPSAMKIPR